LRALLKNNIILYTKTDSGFVPVWRADWCLAELLSVRYVIKK
jgi:hypothetical protein